MYLSGILMPTAFATALSHRLMIFTTAVASAAGLLTAMMDGVNGRPGATFSFIFGHATLLVSFFDVTRLPFLFVRVFVLVTSWHFHPSFMIVRFEIAGKS